MALTAQHTQVWRSKIEAYLDKLAVFVEALTNKNYQGEMAANKTLNIVTYGNITVGTYSGADITFDTPSTTGDTFALDQLKYFGFQVLKKDQYGSLEDLITQFSKRAAIAMNTDTDTYIASLHTNITTNVYGTDAAPKVIGFDTSSGEITPSQALAEIFGLMAANNADMSGVNTVLPAWIAKALLYELKTRSTSFGDTILKTGVKPGKLELGGSIEGYSGIFMSNNVDTATATDGVGGDVWKVMAGTPQSSITFGQGLDDVDSGSLQNNFGTFVKGLHIYGGKIVEQGHMGLGTFRKGHWPNLVDSL
jgi:hypothetical protein